MNISKDSIFQFVIDEITTLNDELETKVDLKTGRETRLFGGGGVLDSLSLVSLIISIEERLEIETNQSVVLATERAMSKRISPFTSVGSLCDYINEMVNEL
jgi:acyl carrier protein